MKRAAILAVGVVFMLLLGAALWRLLPSQDPLFRGRRESERIKGIAYSVGLPDALRREQLQQWRDFGPEGLQVLARALDRPPPGRRYRNFYEQLSRVLPYLLMRHLPDPGVRIKGGPRATVLDLLEQMGRDAWPVWRSVAHLLTDEDDVVRQLAINYFIANDGQFLKEKLPEKKKLLPLFIQNLRDTNSANWGLRNNAAVALKYYPDHAAIAAPALAKALQDSVPQVRIRAAEALHRLDPELAKKAGAVRVLAPLAQESDNQIAASAITVLGDFQNEPDLAVPALIDALRATNSLVVCSAVWALDRAFQNQAKVIIPEMKKAAQRTDDVGGWARNALKNLEKNNSVLPKEKAR